MLELVLLTSILAGSQVIAMTALTKYSLNLNIKYLIIGMISYGIVTPYLIINSLRFKGIGTIDSMVNVITTISMVVIGYFIFNNKVNKLHIFSIFLATAAIISLYYADLL